MVVVLLSFLTLLCYKGPRITSFLLVTCRSFFRPLGLQFHLFGQNLTPSFQFPLQFFTVVSQQPPFKSSPFLVFCLFNLLTMSVPKEISLQIGGGGVCSVVHTHVYARVYYTSQHTHIYARIRGRILYARVYYTYIHIYTYHTNSKNFIYCLADINLFSYFFFIFVCCFLLVGWQS